ncbi:hypothetical protein MBLNU230_g0289t1 [Neophaeotheca triangularis]
MPDWADILPSWISNERTNVSLDAAGLVALADLTTTAQRTVLTGSSSFLDPLILCPGLHRQQDAPSLNGGEYPACAALTTGYVFRVENSAAVFYLQQVGRTGCLTRLSVSRPSQDEAVWPKLSRSIVGISSPMTSGLFATLMYLAIPVLTVGAITLVLLLRDWWGLTVLLILVFSRLINTLIIRARNEPGWKGAPEPNVRGDLLILLSQDRWIRLRGYVDDLKAVTSGQWLRDPTFAEDSLKALATVLVYLDAALAGNARQETKVLLLVLLLASAALLTLANRGSNVLELHGRVVSVEGEAKKYKRRLDLAEELIKETGDRHWAIKMGMIPPESGEEKAKTQEEPAIM